MKIDVRPGDVFECIAGNLWQVRDNTQRYVAIDVVCAFSPYRSESGIRVPRDKALAIIRAYGHEVVEEPERFPRPTHAVIVRPCGIVVGMGSLEECRKYAGPFPVVPIDHWWESHP